MLYGIVLLASIINMFHTMFMHMYKTIYSKLHEVIIASGKVNQICSK